MAAAAAAAEDAAFARALAWWCNATVDEARGGVLGALDRCYWPLGTTVTELAASAAAHCPAFSLASPADVLLVVALHFQWWIGLCLAFLQWYGVGAPASLYYRVSVGAGSLLNLGASTLATRASLPTGVPTWPTCGTAYAMPCFATQSAAFFALLLFVETTRAGGCSAYQLGVAGAVAFAVPLARIAIGYNTAGQALAGTLLGVAVAITVDLLAIVAVDAWMRRRGAGVRL
jgi:hypothetical protein